MKRRTLFLCVHIVSLALIFRLITITITDQNWKSVGIEKLKIAKTIAPDNATSYLYIGRIYQYDLLYPDYSWAIQYYKAALHKNPFYKEAWLNLAQAYQSVQKIEEASSAINNAYKLSPKNPENLWDIGIFYLVNNSNADKAMTYFKKYLEVQPSYQWEIYDICFEMGMSNSYIIKNLLSDRNELYPGYLKYLLQHNQIDQAIDFYQKTGHSFIDEDTALYYCNVLIRNQKYVEALALWRAMIGNDLSDLKDFEDLGPYNGSFEHDVKNACFDWVIGKAEGAAVFIDEKDCSEGHRCLGISFDGNNNVHISAIRQFVILEPNASYLLKADIKSDKLTTTNGLFFSVSGHNCRELNKLSEVVTGTNPWKTIQISFSVPSDCRGAYITLQRNMSRKFNNKIKGTAWVDGIKLIKMMNIR